MEAEAPPYGGDAPAPACPWSGCGPLPLREGQAKARTVWAGNGSPIPKGREAPCDASCEGRHHYVTGRHEVGNYPEDVEQDLQDFISEIIDNEGKDVLTIAAYFHACFENIHPFADGNGRVGRTLLNYYLLTHNVSPVIIYEEDRKEYYKSLERFDTDAASSL